MRGEDEKTGPVSLTGRQWLDYNLVFSIATRNKTSASRLVDARPFSSLEPIDLILVSTHSKGEEARKLEDLRRVSRIWTIEDGSWGFYIARSNDTM